MTLVMKARYKPRPGTEKPDAMIAGFDPSVKGLLVLTGQIIAFDDSEVANALNPEESNVFVIHEAPIMLDAQVLSQANDTDIAKMLASALDEWAAAVSLGLEPIAPVYRVASTIGLRDVPAMKANVAG